MGTAQYMSPEQARGLAVDARTDIWGLGCVLYEMVAGRAPFEGATAIDVILSIVEKELPPLAQYAREVPAGLEQIVTKALRKDREERYQGAKGLAVDLKNLKQELELQAKLNAATPASLSSRALTTSRDHTPVETAKETATSTDVGEAAHPTSSAEYLVKEIKRHRRSVVLGLVTFVIAVATVAYFFYFARGGEAIDSVAVLPFVNVSADPNTEYLTDGITESLINRLARLPALRVTASSTVLRYKGQTVDPQQVGRELKVRAVLMVRVLQEGERLIVGTELVDVATGSRLWGEQYNRKLADILQVQEEIVKQISEKLRLSLTGAEHELLAKRDTENAAAYREYLMGRHFWSQWTAAGLKRGLQHFERAIELDPRYALAYVGVADSYTSFATFRVLSPKEAYPKARAAALKALELNPTLSEAYSTLALVSLYHDWDWVAAEREFKRAIELKSATPRPT